MKVSAYSSVNVAKDDTSAITGSLTWEKWSVWTQRLSPSDARNAQYIYQRYILKSQFLIENFLQLPRPLQITVFDYMERFCPLVDIEASLKLRMKMMVTHPDTRLDHWDDSINWVKDPEPLLIYKMRQYFDREDCDDFDSRAIRFFSKSPYMRRLPATDIYEITAWLLKVVHGSDRVGEVMIALESNANPYSVDDFIHLTESWEAVCNYPIDWAISLLDTNSQEGPLP